MSQVNMKRQHREQEKVEDNGNGNELREPELKMAALEVQQIPLSNEILGNTTIQKNYRIRLLMPTGGFRFRWS
jgi:hypothetical protein